MTERNEKLDKLLSEFFEQEQAKETQDDITAGDEILEGFAAPTPSSMAIEQIKKQVRVKLAAKQRRVLIGRGVQWAAVAAMIVILGLAASMFFDYQKPKGSNIMVAQSDQKVWKDLDEQDNELVIFVEEIDDIEKSLESIRLGEHGNGNGLGVMELEMELIAVNNDFWKG